MKTKYIKKLSAIAFGIALMLTLGMGQAFGWGSAVHAYIDDQIGKKAPVRNLNEVYGAMAADTFNFLFSNFSMLQYLYAVTHYQGIGYADDYLNVWENSHNLLSKVLSFGFVSHNGDFGADLSAHTQSRLYGDEGYVIKKAQDLDGILKLGALPLQPPLTQPQIDEICHDLIEFAIDIMITQQHKALAAKISAAAMFRSPEFPFILAKSYAKGLAKQGFPGIDHAAAVQLIMKTEGEFRKSMISYGQALMQDQDTAIDLIAAQLVGLASQFLGRLLEGEEAMFFLELAKQGLKASMVLCAEDIEEELEKTIEYVADQLAVNGISY